MLLRFFTSKIVGCQLLLISFFYCNVYAEFPKYQNIELSENELIQSCPTSGSYLDDLYTSNIPVHDVHSILEIGSRDGLDALKLSEYYKCHVFAFECNPEALTYCKNNIKNNLNVSLVPFAVWNKTKTISFYSMVETEGVFYNPGASSCFQVDKGGHHRTYVQGEISVPAIRLDEWLEQQKISSIDMLCMDTQGSALQVFEGLGDYLKQVKYIIVELEHTKIYIGSAHFSEVEKFLEEKGFSMYVGKINRFFGDYLFVRKDIIHSWWPQDPS